MSCGDPIPSGLGGSGITSARGCGLRRTLQQADAGLDCTPRRRQRSKQRDNEAHIMPVRHESSGNAMGFMLQAAARRGGPSVVASPWVIFRMQNSIILSRAIGETPLRQIDVYLRLLLFADV